MNARLKHPPDDGWLHSLALELELSCLGISHTFPSVAVIRIELSSLEVNLSLFLAKDVFNPAEHLASEGNPRSPACDDEISIIIHTPAWDVLYPVLR
jgi:hypothetical protein